MPLLVRSQAVLYGGLWAASTICCVLPARRASSSSHSEKRASGNSDGVPKGLNVEPPTPRRATFGSSFRTFLCRLMPLASSQSFTSGRSILPIWARTTGVTASMASITCRAAATPPKVVKSPVRMTPAAFYSSGISLMRRMRPCTSPSTTHVCPSAEGQTVSREPV